MTGSAPTAATAPSAALAAFAEQVEQLQAAYEAADDSSWAQQVTAVTAALAALPEAERPSGAALMEAAAQRAASRATAVRLRDQLPAARVRATRDLPGDLELVELELTSGERVAVLAPARPPLRSTARLRRAVDVARTAALTGTCPQCTAGLDVTDRGELEVTHRRDCRAAPAALARARRR